MLGIIARMRDILTRLVKANYCIHLITGLSKAQLSKIRNFVNNFSDKIWHQILMHGI